MKKGSASSEAELPVKAQRRRDRGGANSSSSADSYGRDYTPFKRWVAWLVPLFTAVNVIIFFITMYVNDCPKHTGSACIARFLGRFSFQPMKENPLLGPSSTTLQKMGASDVSEVVKNRQVWRLFTCIWLHAGVFHLLANMLSLLFIGIRLEQEFGFVRIGMLYILSGFGGSLLSALFIQSSISVGASGALFGLLGSMLSELITNWTIYANKLAALLTLIVVITINLAFGILPHVDNFAHIGGFLSGFLLGFVFLIRPQFGWLNQRNAPPGYVSTSYKPKHKPYQHILWIVSLVLLIVGYVVGLVVLFKEVNANEYCHWCHYLSCIPTSKWKCNNTQVFCQASQTGDQLSLECVNGGNAGNYTLMDDNPSTIKRLCYELCS